MSKDRLIYIVVAAALLVVAGLVIHQSVATAKVVSDNASVSATDQAAACPFSAEDLKSLRAEYDQENGIWLIRTDRGSTGQEGGLSALLNCPAPGSR